MNLPLDFHSGLPLYKQIENAIRRKILGHELKVGELIPPEIELEKTLAISRAPIRQAISKLVNEGYLVRRSGKGTFVSKVYNIRRVLPRLNSFTEEMKAQGISPESRILSVGFINKGSSSKWIFKQLRDDRIFSISRLRLVEGTPVCILQSYLPAKIGMREDDDYTGSLYELLEKKYRIVIVGGEEKITATIADSHRAKLLEIPKGSPLISIQRTTFSNHQVPIEIIEGYYRADRFYFTIQLHRDLEKSIPRLVHSNRGFRSTSL